MMKGRDSISVCLFFTYGVSLQSWRELGLLDREVLLYRKLAECGVNVAFFTYGDEGDLEFKENLQGIEIISAYADKRRPRRKLARFLRSFVLPLRFCESLSSYSIMKTNQMMGAWAPLAASLLAGKCFLVRCGYEMYRTDCKQQKKIVRRTLSYILSRIVYSVCQCISITTQNDAKFISRIFKVPQEKIRVIPNFVDTALFAPFSSEWLHDSRVIYIGRLHQEKNLHNLILACAKSKVGLDIIGRGPWQAPLEAYSRSLGADVRCLGVFPNKKLPKLLAKYSVFILPSLYEGNPKSLLEAMSCGKAVIGTDVDGIREIIRHEENGLLCGTDADSLADAIKRLFSDTELRKRLGKAAREYVLHNCSIGLVVEKELSLYKDILKQTKPR